MADFHHLVEKVCIVSRKAWLRFLSNGWFKPSHHKLPFTSTYTTKEFSFFHALVNVPRCIQLSLKRQTLHIPQTICLNIWEFYVCVFNSAIGKVRESGKLKNGARSASECHCFPVAHLLCRKP